MFLLRHDISLGSVATHLSCGEICSNSVITNALLIQRVGKLENPSIFDEVRAYEVKACKKVCQFLGPPVYIYIYTMARFLIIFDYKMNTRMQYICIKYFMCDLICCV